MISVSVVGSSVGWRVGLVLLGLMWAMNSANKRRWDALATVGVEKIGTIVDRQMVRSGKGFSPVYRISYRNTLGKRDTIGIAILFGVLGIVLFFAL